MRFRLCPVLLLCLCLVPLAAHADAVVKIMPLGDSITRGGPGADTPYPSYRYYLDESLRASGYGVDFVGSGSSAYGRFVFDQQHDGHGGYTTGMMVGTSSFSPLAAWLAASPTPEIVLLHVGTNDAINGVPVATRLANVKQIVTLLRQKNPKVRVMVAKIIPTGDATRNAQQIAPFNAGLPGLAAEVSTASSPVTVVDLYAGYDGVADNQPDGIHPKTTGERKMAGAWQRALAPILSATPTPTTKAPTTVPTTALTTGMPSGQSIPGTLEAENYNPGGEGVGYHDATPTNQGGAYRTDAVDIEAITGGGYTVGYVRDGEWLQYTVNVASAGTYAAAFRVASWGTAAHSIEVQVNGNPAATVAVPSTGSYDAWTTATATLSLPAGTCSLKLRFVGDGQNLDRVVFAPIAVTTAPTTVPTTVAPTLSGRRVPGTIEAEDYNAGGEGVGYHDTTPGNHDNVYRHDGVDLSVNPSGGYNVGYVVDGEWLAYTLAVPSAGTYTVSCSVASWADGRSLALALDGASLGTLAVPNNLCSGWRTVSRQVALPAGTHRLVVRFVGDKQDPRPGRGRGRRDSHDHGPDTKPRLQSRRPPCPRRRRTRFRGRSRPRTTRRAARASGTTTRRRRTRAARTGPTPSTSRHSPGAATPSATSATANGCGTRSRSQRPASIAPRSGSRPGARPPTRSRSRSTATPRRRSRSRRPAGTTPGPRRRPRSRCRPAPAA